MKAEHELLLACAAAETTTERTERVVRALRRQIDWKAFRSSAWNHGVLPLVHRQLTAAAAAGAAVPAEVMDGLREFTFAQASVNLRLTSELVTLADALEQAGIPVISYKGPSLAWRAYGDLSLRHFSDLDVLVRKEDLRAAVRSMLALGYTLRDPAGAAEERATLRWGHHFSFVREPQSLVEVHWRFHKPLFGDDLAAADVWSAARHEEIAGFRLRTLSRVHEFLVLATHGSWHGWAQLSWVCDVAELATRTPDLDVEALLEAARGSGCLRAVLLAFHLSHSLLGNELPPAIAAATAADDDVVHAAGVIAHRMEQGSRPDHESARLQLALRERFRDKASFAVRAAFVPNPSDIRALPLPGWLFPLYYVARPVRMALKYRPRS